MLANIYPEENEGIHLKLCFWPLGDCRSNFHSSFSYVLVFINGISLSLAAKCYFTEEMLMCYSNSPLLKL